MKRVSAIAAWSLLSLIGSQGRADTLVLSGATVHPISGPILDVASVVVTDGVIVSVGTERGVPADAERVDLSGMHLYPGLINMSTLLGLYEIRDVVATRDERELGTLNPNIRAEVALNPSSELLPVARADGVLVYLTYPVGGRVSGTAALAYTAGWTVDDMTVRAPVALVVNWPTMNLGWDHATSLDTQRSERQDRIRELDEWIADAAAFADVHAHADERSRGQSDVKWEAMVPAVRGEIPILARVRDARQIRSALDWAERHHLDLVLATSRDASMFATELAARDVGVIVIGSHMTRPRNGEPYDTVYQEAARLHDAGVTFAFGTGMTPYGTYNARQLADLAGVAVGFGLPSDAALRAMTLSAAEIAGVDDRLGSIEVGKEATLIATGGDLLEIRIPVTRAWIRGAEVSLQNKHRTLYETYRARPRPSP